MTITLHAPLVVPLEEVRLLAFECARRRIAKPADLPFGATQREAGLEKAFSWQGHTPRKRGPKTKVRIEAYLEEQAVAMAEFAKDAALIAALQLRPRSWRMQRQRSRRTRRRSRKWKAELSQKSVCVHLSAFNQCGRVRGRPCFLCLESTQLPF